MLYFLIGRLNIEKMTILHKLICKFHAVSITIPTRVSTDADKIICNLHGKAKETE